MPDKSLIVPLAADRARAVADAADRATARAEAAGPLRGLPMPITRPGGSVLDAVVDERRERRLPDSEVLEFE
jgi:hypothetical protein